MTSGEAYDVVVIGGGMAGISAACELAAAARVLLVERESQLGYHSTGRSAAILTENYGNAVIRKLTIASRTFFAAPPPGFTEHPLLAPRGVLFLARADQGRTFEAALTLGRSLVSSIRAVGVEEALAICPVLRPGYLAQAMLEPDAMDLDVHAILQGYLALFRRRGGQILTDAPVTALRRRGGRWEVRAGDAEVTAAVLVAAAGAWGDDIARMAGAAPIGLVPKRRTAATFDPPAGMAVGGWPLVLDVDEKFYFKPESGRLMASPADETPMPPCDVQPEELDVAEGIDRVERATTLEVQRIHRRWAGLRTFAADKSPVVGPDPSVPGFVWLAGQGGYGIMTSPAMSRIVAGLVLEGRIPDDLAAMGLHAEDLVPARLRVPAIA